MDTRCDSRFTTSSSAQVFFFNADTEVFFILCTFVLLYYLDHLQLKILLQAEADSCALPSSTASITVMGSHSDTVHWCLLTVTVVQVIGLIRLLFVTVIWLF